MPAQHYWEIWYPSAAATGLLIARCQIDAADSVILHAGGDVVAVEVYGEDRKLIARGRSLARTEDSPMCRLSIVGQAVTREDLWPTEADVGTTVILPGGEAGILKSWWNAPDRSEWRWHIEFYNKRS